MELKKEPAASTEEDVILELAIEYVLGNGYPSDLASQGSKACMQCGRALPVAIIT